MTGAKDELGRYKKGHKVSDEQLDKMAEGRRAGSKARKEVELNANLSALGFVEPFPADILTLGKLFVEGKGGSVSAYNKLLALSPTRKEELALWDADSGDPCPTCRGESGDTLSKLTAKYPGLLDAIIKYTDIELEKLKGDIDVEDPE